MVRKVRLVALLLGSAALFSACGNPQLSHSDDTFDSGTRDGQDAAAGSSGGDDGGLVVGSAGTSVGVTETLTVKAESSTVTVNIGEAPPEVAVTAFLGNAPVQAAWNVDRGDLASISPGVGTLEAAVERDGQQFEQEQSHHERASDRAT